MATAAVIGLAVVPASSSAAERANPFTGTSASYEQRLRLLEEKKLDAAIANEELAAEKANQERLRLRTGRASGLMGDVEPRRAIVIPSQPSALPSVRAPIATRAPRLVGTVSTPSGWLALIEAEGRVTSVREGQTVAGVKVTAIGREMATLNGTPTTLQPVIARVELPSAVAKIGPASNSPTAPPDVIDLLPGRK